MTQPPSAPAMPEIPEEDLLCDLWQWPAPGLDLFIARPVLEALAEGAALPSETAGFLVGRHLVLHGEDEQPRQVVVVLNLCFADWLDGLGLDEQPLAALLARPGVLGQGVVGWFRAHHGDGIFLHPAEIAVHQRDFPEPFHVACIVDSQLRQAGFFFREKGQFEAGPGQCRSIFDPVTLRISKRGRATGSGGRVKRRVRQLVRAASSDGAVGLLALAIGLLVIGRSLPARGPIAPQDDLTASGVPQVQLAVSRSDTSVKLAIAARPGARGERYLALREGPLPAGKLKALFGSRLIRADQGAAGTDAPASRGAYRYVVLPVDAEGEPGQPWDSAALALHGHHAGLSRLW